MLVQHMGTSKESRAVFIGGGELIRFESIFMCTWEPGFSVEVSKQWRSKFEDKQRTGRLGNYEIEKNKYAFTIGQGKYILSHKDVNSFRNAVDDAGLQKGSNRNKGTAQKGEVNPDIRFQPGTDPEMSIVDYLNKWS